MSLLNRKEEELDGLDLEGDAEEVPEEDYQLTVFGSTKENVEIIRPSDIVGMKRYASAIDKFIIYVVSL